VQLLGFDLLELDGTDLRQQPMETRKATLASLLRENPCQDDERGRPTHHHSKQE
jgi:ATP-dependent DNA ligase